MTSKSDMIFISIMATLFVIGVYLGLEIREHSAKEIEFIQSANCSELNAFIKDGVVNGSKYNQQKAETYYLLECDDKTSQN